MDILVVAPHGNLDPSALGELTGAARLTAVCWDSQAPTTTTMTVLAVPARNGVAARLRERFLSSPASRNPIARSALRLTSFDEGRWFWLAASHADAVSASARTARVIVAADRDAVYAAWRWAREARRAGHDVAAVYGYPAARAAIAEAAQA